MRRITSSVLPITAAVAVLACSSGEGRDDGSSRLDPTTVLLGAWVCQDPFGRGASQPTVLLLRESGRMAFGLLQADGSVLQGGLLTRGTWNLEGSRIDLYSSSGALVQEARVQFASDGSVSRLTFNGDPCDLDDTGRYRSIY